MSNGLLVLLPLTTNKVYFTPTGLYELRPTADCPAAQAYYKNRTAKQKCAPTTLALFFFAHVGDLDAWKVTCRRFPFSSHRDERRCPRLERYRYGTVWVVGGLDLGKG